MNVIFLTMSRISGISEWGLYTDLMRRFRDNGHQVYIVTPHERYMSKPTELFDVDGVHILGVKTLNLRKTNVLEKGIGQMLVETQYKRSIRRYLKTIDFGLILYSTPPITFPRTIKYLKDNNPSAITYLLLKDIFPQNAVDIGMLSKSGIKGILYSYFRKKEKKLYALSNYIGCMSPANVQYILEHNPEITSDRIEVAPNSIELKKEDNISPGDSNELELKNKRYNIRSKYNLPNDRPIFIYGGNLGKPQGIPFLIKCLEANADRDDCHFIVIGSGTELPKLKKWSNERCPKSVTIMNGLPQEEYDELVQACDVGLIFLDHRFTIPNFPSRVLSYLENRMPILCSTDPNCDMGRIAEANGFGYWCESNSVVDFTAIVDKMVCSDRKTMGENGYKYLCENYLIDNTFNVIMSHV